MSKDIECCYGKGLDRLRMLDSYVQGTADEKLRKEIEEHLPKCKACHDEVKERFIFKNLLTKKLGTPEGPHLDFENIEAFYHNKLGEEKRTEALDHLIYCDDCRENLEIIRTKQMIDKGKVPGYGKAPDKLPSRLEDYINKKPNKK